MFAFIVTYINRSLCFLSENQNSVRLKVLTGWEWFLFHTKYRLKKLIVFWSWIVYVYGSINILSSSFPWQMSIEIKNMFSDNKIIVLVLFIFLKATLSDIGTTIDKIPLRIWYFSYRTRKSSIVSSGLTSVNWISQWPSLLAEVS